MTLFPSLKQGHYPQPTIEEWRFIPCAQKCLIFPTCFINWIHRYLYYTLIYNPVVHYIYVYIHANIHVYMDVYVYVCVCVCMCVCIIVQIIPALAIGRSQVVSRAHLTFCLLFIPARCSRFILYIFWPSLRSTHFFKEPWFLWLENSIKIDQDFRLGPCRWSVFAFKTSVTRSGNVLVYSHPYIMHICK